MADLADVEQALVGLISAALYPSGVPSGPAPASVAGPPVRVRRGWPLKDALDADLKVGLVNTTVHSVAGLTRNTTRYSTEWRLSTLPTPTLAVAVSGSQATWGGTGGVGSAGSQLAGVRVAGQAYVHALQPTDGPADVAVALAAMIPGASASGPMLTVPPCSDFAARVSAPATLSREVRRQVQGIQVTLWCPTPAIRDAVAAVVDGALAEFDGLHVPLPDGSGGLLKYTGTVSDDATQKAGLYRRDLRLTVEYATTQTMQAPQVLWGVQVTGGDTASPVITSVQ